MSDLKVGKMSIFFEDDYPDWVDDMLDNAIADSDSNGFLTDFDQRVWDIAKDSEKPPHIGNLITYVSFNIIIEILSEKYSIDYDLFNYYINAICSDISFDGEYYCDYEELKEAIEKYIKDE
jgi:hypothetical protein